MVRGLLLTLLLAGCDVVFGLERDPAPPPVPGEWAAVASGNFHSCAIQTDRTLWCWGENTFGETGLSSGTPPEVLAPAQVGEDHWATITTGSSHTCGLHDDSTLWCWGFNLLGSVGDATHETRFAPVQIGTEHWRAVAAGAYSTCAIRDSDRSLWCWGSNNLGQLGDGTTGERAAPALADSTHRWAAVSLGVNHACALTEEQALYCWGDFPLPGGPQLRPTAIEAGVQWNAIASGAGLVCGIDTAGTVKCLGLDNTFGELGDGTTTPHPAAAPINSMRSDWVAIAARNYTACALSADGTLACWGENRRGQIGSDTAAPLQLSPHELDGSWSAVAPGWMHTCAIDSDAHLQCTGSGAMGQRGDGSPGSQLAPEKLDGVWSAIDTGDVTTCGVRSGKLWCWGDNGAGQLGEGTLAARQVPVQTATISPSSAIAVGQYHVCAWDTAGDVYCWGDNHLHQLGYMVTADTALLPVKVSTQASMPGGIAAYDQTCVVTAPASSSVCFGSNSRGQLGRAAPTMTTSGQYVPVNNGTVGLVFEGISAGYEHACGITAGDDQVYCWGRDDEGQLGVSSTNSVTFAVPTGLMPTYAVAAGGYHTCAIKADGSLLCWGSNLFGQLGDGTSTMRTQPVRIGSALWTVVSAGTAHTCAIQTGDRSLWCWGSSSRGGLGDGTQQSRWVPTKIGSAAWLTVSAGDEYTCGIQMDGSAWCWGSRLWGNLGDNKAWTNRFARTVMP